MENSFGFFEALFDIYPFQEFDNSPLLPAFPK